MTLQVPGKILLQNVACEKCGNQISLHSYKSGNLKCLNCGATYEIIKKDINNDCILYEFSFIEFRCVTSNAFKECDNFCPAPNMLCKEHTNDKAFESALNTIKYCEERLTMAKDLLSKIEESKKIWLIEELSGLEK